MGCRGDSGVKLKLCPWPEAKVVIGQHSKMLVPSLYRASCSSTVNQGLFYKFELTFMICRNNEV